MRILLIDSFFPSVFAKWRLVEIHSFITTYNADICVLSCNKKFCNVTSEFNYEELREKFQLDNYNILIFNPDFNYINKYNSDFDGTIFNNKLNGVDYIFRFKEGISDHNMLYNYDIHEYDVYYHIFLSIHKLFNHKVVKDIPLKKQYLHLYPGGGFTENKPLSNIMKYFRRRVVGTNIIYTQKFIEPYVENKTKCRKLYCYGVPLLYKDEVIRKKKSLVVNKKLCVAFTSMGDPIAKGLIDFLHIANISKKLQLPITFITIGNCSDISIINNINNCPNLEELKETHTFIKHYLPMSQHALDDFYYNNVDVYLNLEMFNENQKNGWPLGAEPTLQGCVLLTKDNYNQNAANNYPIDNFFIINEDFILTINKLIQLLNNRFFISKSVEIQNAIYNVVNYDNTMKPIFNFIENK